MKKRLKVFLIILGIIISLFLIFITEESIRLSKNANVLPLIITDRTKYCVECINIGEEIEVAYFSLGYKVKVKYTVSPDSHDDLKFIQIIGKEFLLFNKLRLWSWIS